MNDFYDEIKKIQPLEISSAEFNRNGIPKNIRKSIDLYNSSISYLKVKNIDSAVNILKKSLSYNPSFCEAIKLLSLCYAYKNDFSEAEKYLDDLRKYSIYRRISNEYLEKVQVEKSIANALDTIKNVGNSNTNFKLLKTKGNGILLKKSAVVFTSIIIAAGLLVLAYRLYPSIKVMSNKTETHRVADKSVENNKYTQLNNDYKNLQTNYENTKSELDNLKNAHNITLQLNEAENAYKDGNYEKAVQILLTLKNLTLDDSSKAEFDTLWNDIKSNNVWTIYNQANSLYKQKKYTEALPKLRLVEEIPPDKQLMPWLLYQIGTCYKETNDPSNALIYFQKVKSEYPNSKYAHYSN